MKTAASMERSSRDATGSTRLELLCQTAIMQGSERRQPIGAPSHSVKHGFKAVTQEAKTPSLSSEPESPTASAAINVDSQVTGSTTTKWFPPAFVDLKNNKTPTLIPQVPCHKTTVAATTHTSISQATMPAANLKLEHPSMHPVKSIPLVAEPRHSAIENPRCPLGGKSQPSYKELISENVQLKIELGEAKKEIARLKKDMAKASCNISELRGTLTGGNKISEIPLVDMIEIMQEYGSEVSGQSFQKRKEDPQPASIVRQFRRWNPDFLKYFYRKNGKWLPKLGKAGELQRRKLKRDALRAHRRNPPQGPQPRAI